MGYVFRNRQVMLKTAVHLKWEVILTLLNVIVPAPTHDGEAVRENVGHAYRYEAKTTLLPLPSCAVVVKLNPCTWVDASQEEFDRRFFTNDIVQFQPAKQSIRMTTGARQEMHLLTSVVDIREIPSLICEHQRDGRSDEQCRIRATRVSYSRMIRSKAFVFIP